MPLRHVPEKVRLARAMATLRRLCNPDSAYPPRPSTDEILDALNVLLNHFGRNEREAASPVKTFDFADGNGLVTACRHRNPDGSIGGWVASTARVAETAYIGPGARVYGKARVYGSAKVVDAARIFGNAWVRHNACIGGRASIYGDAHVTERVKVSGHARICGSAWLFGHKHVSGSALINGIVEQSTC